MGWKNAQQFQNVNWDKIDENPRLLTKNVGDWLLEHNPEQYAYENYADCAKGLLEGKSFKNTNGVPGHTFKLWTVKEMLDTKRIVDDGDWS
jgi:hypothetical protein